MNTPGIIQAKCAAISASTAAFNALLEEIATRYPKRDPFTIAERLELRGVEGNSPFKAALAHYRRCQQVEESVVSQYLAAGCLSLH